MFDKILMRAGERSVSKMLKTGWKKTIPTLITKFFSTEETAESVLASDQPGESSSSDS